MLLYWLHVVRGRQYHKPQNTFEKEEGLDFGMKLSYSLFIVALFAVASAQVRSVWYVKPTTDSLCPAAVPDEQCYTLPQILHNGTLAEIIFSSNTILAFLAGDHVLDFQSEAFLVIKNLENLTFLGSPEVVSSRNQLSRPASRIVCQSSFAIAFVNISRLSLTNITLSGCGANITEELAVMASTTQAHAIHVIGPELKAALLLVNIKTFQMISCFVDNSFGYGLLGINVLEDSAVVSSVFYSNNFYTTTIDRCILLPNKFPDDVTACSGGNALFVFEDLLECPSSELRYTLLIRNSAFALGVNGYGGRLPDTYLTRGTGIGIVMAQSSYGVTVTLDTIAAYGNSALIGANIYVAMYEMVDNSSISIQNSNSVRANGGLLDFNIFEQSQSASGGLHFDYNLPANNSIVVRGPVCYNKNRYQEDILSITGSDFSNNVAVLAPGTFLTIRTSASDDHIVRFRIEGCTYSNNVGTSGVGVYISQQNSFYGRGTSQVIIKDVNFTNNRYVTPIRNLTLLYTNFQLSTVQLINTENVTLTGCRFVGNEASGLTAFGSRVTMSGFVVFRNNSGIRGGAINLQSSNLILTPNTRIEFKDNYAFYQGGALNVVGRSDVVLPCFFQISDPSFRPDPNITLFFQDNYAEEAGSVLFGGAIDRCIVAVQSSLFVNTSGEIFDFLADVGPHSDASSLISSEPQAVCVCVNDVMECALRDAMVFLPPGATFEFPFVVTGQRSGITPSSVYVVITDPDTTLGQFQTLQQVAKTCTYLNFTVSTAKSNSTTLTVRTGDLADDGSFEIDIQILPCPDGFLLDGSGECICDPVSQLDDYESQCDINTQTVHREGGSWVNSSYLRSGTYDGVLVLLNCPNRYCLSEATKLDLSDPDSQCDFNRTGILCGACKPGLSLTLGSSGCSPCSNNYLALLIGYALAGFVLVVVLFLLDFTTTNATFNGIIFYANILQMNQPIFFPPQSFGITTIFIGWLNLDTGVDSCFYDGFDGYARVWLNFPFPVYIWFIMFATILISRISPTITRLCGSRSVPVLASLLLLSYNKLLRAVILSLSWTSIVNPDSSFHVVWSQDGNIDFWKGKHFVLALFATAVLLFFIIPYTLLLVLVPLPCVQAVSTYRCFSWINKLKPFMDAHQGPYKNNFRNWTGILLLVRIVLAVSASVNIGQYDSDTILFVISVVMSLLVAFGWVSSGGMYKKWPHNVLECSFFLNLGILSISMLFLTQGNVRGQRALILTSSWVALVQFGGILVYHIYKQLNSIRRLREWRQRFHTPGKGWRSMKEAKDEEVDTSVSQITFTELREPLIED